MTKRMRELQAKILEKHIAAKSLMEGEAKDLAGAEKLLNEADELQKEFDLEARLEATKKTQLPDTAEPVVEQKADGFTAMAKMMSGKALDEGEKALITGSNAVNGENYLIPDDVKAAINELRKSYISAKDIITVETTDSLAGSVNYEKDTVAGLTDFEDGDAIAEGAPEFEKKSFAIKWKGKLIPVSRILKGAEKGDLMGYLNRWFVKNAIVSENADIFAALKEGYNSGVPKAVTGWKGLKKSINADLDPSCKVNGLVVTNQSGFAVLDEEEDNNGRPILQPNPANPTEKLFQGLPVKVYPDAQLPNIDSTHFPVFYGDTKAGATMKEHKGLEFSVSEHYLFNKNQDCLRVVEGYDVMSTDTSAYIYGSLSATVKA